MASQFKLIGILGKVKNSTIAETLRALVGYLKTLDQAFLLDTEITTALNESSFPNASHQELSERCDLFIVVGGDGSLLHAAHIAASNEIPIFGINRGRLGFLTDILPTQLRKIRGILEGDFILEKRFLLSATVQYHGNDLGLSDALNEVALIPDSQPHMNEFEIYIDDQFVCSQDSDGVIIATPTGSTAYALSGGGPILHPKLDAIVIVPMFPHTLSMRPIVIDGNSEVTLVITPRNTATPRLTCDGQAFINTPPGSHIHIKKKKKRLHLIHPIDYDYYESLRSKLHWGRKLSYTE